MLDVVVALLAVSIVKSTPLTLGALSGILCERSGKGFVLVQIDEQTFAPEDPALPERLRFDAVVDGKALRANASGCDYYRSFED